VLDDELKAYNKKYGLNTKGQTSVIYWCGNSAPENKNSLPMVQCDWREIIY
jgi:hypothetical protein